MKKIFILLFLLSVVSTNAQFQNSLKPNEGLMQGGLGLTWVDGQPFYALRVCPEFGFANFGLGLDLNLAIDSKGNMRKENYNELSDYLSIIRYARYGQKHDPVYVKVGTLDYTTLGHGSLMYMYNNSPTFDARKIGAQFDMDFNEFGFESIYSNFAQAGVFGMRAYVRPLKLTSMKDIPVISNLEIGATYVTDFNKYSGVTAGEIDPISGEFKATKDDGSVSAFGFDLGLPLVRNDLLNVDLYYDFAKIINYGSGSTAGISATLKGLGLVELSAKLERRFNNDEFLPSYFNSMYETERFNFDPATGQVRSKIQSLQLLQSSVGNGFFGELEANVVDLFRVIGSYERLDKEPKSGALHITGDVVPKDLPYVVRAGYDKINIEDEKDLFTLDERSYLFVEVGYKPMPYLVVSMVYNWTFSPVRDSDDNIIGYEPQKWIEPRVSFVYPLNF
ncbi:MAG: hypothetical protein V1773_13240 [bacterium]